ncbi:unnamed protein product [Peniophora sp. CBMAI 1063]|nr:unnamed protein product [Peniophora sp. CBMAI 1063]
MRAASSTGTPGSQNSSRGLFHPYSPASPASGAWLFSDSSEESSWSAADSLLCDDGVHPISASFKRGGLQPPQRLVLYPTPTGTLATPINERGCPTVAQYLAVETSYVNDHAPARRQKALLSYESMCEIAQVLASYNEPVIQLEDGRLLHATYPATGIMATSAMRHWARSKFTLSHDGAVLCKGKQVLVREQFYSALCWAHMQSAHGGRDKTSRVLWRFAGVPKELIMRFVASCPTCIDKTAALRRTGMHVAARPEEKSVPTPEESDEGPDAPDPEPTARELSPQLEGVSLPPLSQLLSSIFRDSDELRMPSRGPTVLDSPTNFSPVGSAFDEVPSPPQGYVSEHMGYSGGSLPSPSDADVMALDGHSALQHVFSQFDHPAQPTTVFGGEASPWGCPLSATNDNEEVTDDSCISDESEFPSILDYSSSPITQAPARDALMFAWSTAPMQRQAATEGVGLSPPSSPLMRGYARLASPIVEDSPSATAHLLGGSPLAGGGISGWSPSSALSTSPGVANTGHFPSPVFNNTAIRLYDTPLTRFSNRTFQERWEAMYSARNVNLSHLQDLPPVHSLEGTEGHAIMVEDDSSADETSMADAPAVESAQGDELSLRAPSLDMQYAALGFVHKPIGRARAHSHSLGLALQTDFSAEGAPTPPLTATSTLSARSPVSPGLQTPAHSLLMQIVSSGKDDSYGASAHGVKLEPVDENMLPWNEGFPTEHDPLAPYNMLHDWINMDYAQGVDEHPLKLEDAGEQVAPQASSHLSGVPVA